MSDRFMGSPQITLAFEGMRHQIVHSMILHHEAIENNLEKELKNVIENYDFAGVVRAHVDQLMKEAIKGALQQAVYKAMQDESVLSMLDIEVRTSMAKILRERMGE